MPVVDIISLSAMGTLCCLSLIAFVLLTFFDDTPGKEIAPIVAYFLLTILTGIFVLFILFGIDHWGDTRITCAKYESVTVSKQIQGITYKDEERKCIGKKHEVFVPAEYGRGKWVDVE